MKDKYTVKRIERGECEPFVIGIHYAHRWPSISYAYGLFLGDSLVGVCTYGTPFSTTLRKGLAGGDMARHVLELNRLCLRDNLKMEASLLVGRSLRMLGRERDSIVVSFADTSQDHTGIVYQATNFLYCGLSAKRTDWKLKGKENLHGQTISDEFRGVKNRAKAMRDKYGDDFYLAPRPRKHRYVTFVGNKRFKRSALSALKYNVSDYPKRSVLKNDP